MPQNKMPILKILQFMTEGVFQRVSGVAFRTCLIRHTVECLSRAAKPRRFVRLYASRNIAATLAARPHKEDKECLDALYFSLTYRKVLQHTRLLHQQRELGAN
jgi:hypothetical protein